MKKQKRILAINDISCFGKCSLTSVVPILSAAGIETCVLPTAILSSHTAFAGYTFCDMTEELPKITNHWKEMALQFDGIYSGYLGSVAQVAQVESLIEAFPAEFVLIDPVMGDNGRLYQGIDAALKDEMKRLIKKANVIVPNVTEASFLTGIPYEETHSEAYVKSLLEALSRMTEAEIVLTGIHGNQKTIATAVYVPEGLFEVKQKYYPVCYSGTGDVFASGFAAAKMHGLTTYVAAKLAAIFVEDSILATKKTAGSKHYGLNFELCTPSFLRGLGLV